MVTLLLWAPFLLVALIVGLIFCIRGYKKGVVRSAFALGATIFAAIASLLISPLVSKLLTKALLPMASGALEEMVASMDTFVQSIVSGMLEGLVSMVIATLLFPLVFLILSIIARTVASCLSRGKFEPANSGLRWGGFGVGLVDTLVYALVLLLPLYGTISSIAPVAGGFMDEETGAIIEEVGAHPLVSVSGAGPFGLVFNTLTSVNNGGVTIKPVEMVQEINEFTTQVQTLINTSPEEFGEAEIEQIQDLCSNMAESSWFAPTVNVVYNELKNVGNLDALELETELTFKEDEIKALGTQISDVAVEVIQAMKDGDEAALENMDMSLIIGEALNSSPTAASLKFTIINFLVNKAVSEYDDGQTYQQQVMQEVPVAPLTDPEEIKAEGEVILQLLEGGFTETDAVELLEVVAQHPQVDEAAINQIIVALTAD